MTTEQEIAEHQVALLDAVAKGDWDNANKAMGWLSQSLDKNQLIEFYPDLLKNLDKQIGENCETPTAFTMRGYVKNELGNHYSAIEDFDNAIRFESSNSGKAMSYFYRGVAYDKLGLTQESIESINKSIKLKSDYTNAHYYLGNIMRKSNDFKAAIKNYTNTIQFNSNHAYAYNDRGIAKLKLNDRHGALSDLNDAIDIKSDDARFYNNRGNIKSTLGDSHGALSDYNDAIRLDPDDANTYYNRGLVKFEMAHKNHKNWDKEFKDDLEKNGAIDDFRNALRLDQSNDKYDKIRQFENAVRFVSYIDKNIEFGKNELDKRRISHERSVKYFLRTNYALSLIFLILLPSSFFVFLYYDSKVISVGEVSIGFQFLLNYLNRIPSVVYIMLSIGIFAPTSLLMMQIFFIHRLEYRTHQSKFPVSDPESDLKFTYGNDNQSAYLESAIKAGIAANSPFTSSGD